MTATRVVLRVREEEEEEEEEEEIVEEEEGGRELEVSLTVEVLMVLRQRERETERGGSGVKCGLTRGVQDRNWGSQILTPDCAVWPKENSGHSPNA